MPVTRCTAAVFSQGHYDRRASCFFLDAETLHIAPFFVLFFSCRKTDSVNYQNSRNLSYLRTPEHLCTSNDSIVDSPMVHRSAASTECASWRGLAGSTGAACDSSSSPITPSCTHINSDSKIRRKSIPRGNMIAVFYKSWGWGWGGEGDVFQDCMLEMRPEKSAIV